MINKQASPQPILLIQRMGSGKSSVYQTLSIIDIGITIVVECTFSLGSDQLSKMNDKTYDGGTLLSYQVDSLKSCTDQIAVSAIFIQKMFWCTINQNNHIFCIDYFRQNIAFASYLA